MIIRDREKLVARIRQIRPPVEARKRASDDADDPQADRVRALETRVARLEQQIEALQDSVHRESERHARQIVELQSQVQPGAMGAALAEDARNRGL